MHTTVICNRKTPCQGCPDRYPACSDHCRKPDFLAWKQKQETIRRNRKAYCCSIWKHEEPYQRRKPTRPKRRQ